MERAEHPVVSPLSNSDVQRIASKVDRELDTFDDNIEVKEFSWMWPRWIFPRQRLLRSQAENAQKYINYIVKRDYPYGIREYMGRQLWVEFCEYWALNPDFDKAIRYL